MLFIKVDGVKQAINVDRCKPAYILKRDILNSPMPEPIWKDFKDSGYTDNEEVEGTVKGEILPRTIGKPVLPVLDQEKYAAHLPFDKKRVEEKEGYNLRTRKPST